MKIFITLILIILTFPREIIAAFPGECYVIKASAYGSETIGKRSDFTINSTGGIVQTYTTGYISEASWSSLKIKVWYYVNGTWSGSGGSTWGHSSKESSYLFDQEMEWSSDYLEPDNPPVGACPDPCGDGYANKVFECGGEEHVESWSQDTCQGFCYCEENPDDPNTNTFKDFEAFCGGLGRIQMWDKTSCTGDCKGCDEEYQAKEEECALLGFEVNRDSPNRENCEYECLPNCDQEIDIIENECVAYGVDYSGWDEESCSGAVCNVDCSDEWQAKTTECGIAGIDTSSWSDSTCTGKCRDCEWAEKDCDERCGGLGLSICNQMIVDGVITGIEYGDCECGDPVAAWEGFAEGGSVSFEEDGYAFGDPGQMGGEVENNPDGSVTETLETGTQITYSPDGRKISAVTSNGYSFTRTLNEDGSIASTARDNDGNVSFELTYTDPVTGLETVTTKQGVDINHNNPELPEQIMWTFPETTTSTGGTDTPGLVTGDPTETDPEKVEEEEESYTITSIYNKKESYSWTDRIAFAEWDAAKSNFYDKSPAGIYSKTITPLIARIQASPVVPVFTVPIISGSSILPEYSVSIDLSMWNTVVGVFKFFIGLLMVVMTFRGIPKVWTGGG